MRRELFLCFVDGVLGFDPWFRQTPYAAGRPWLSTYQKCTVALRMLAYGIPVDAIDEYARLGESTALEAMKRWMATIHSCFSATYLRQPMRADLERQIRINTNHGFPRMFASLDCMH